MMTLVLYTQHPEAHLHAEKSCLEYNYMHYYFIRLMMTAELFNSVKISTLP